MFSDSRVSGFYFNPRPPRGGRLPTCMACCPSSHFNPRPPRGGRRYVKLDHSAPSHFNPRPPRGGRLVRVITKHSGKPVISIHAPREGGDVDYCIDAANSEDISIHAPPRGGDGGGHALFELVFISIHAPREGGDSAGMVADTIRTDFNPRPPRGGRRRHVRLCYGAVRFQSTPPARGAT